MRQSRKSSLPLISQDGQCHRETAAALRSVDHVAAVPASNLAHESEAEAGAPLRVAPADAVEHRKQSFAVVRSNDLSCIGYAEHGVVVALLGRDLDRAPAMEMRVFDEVADHSAQQRRVSPDHDRSPPDKTILVPHAFLGGESHKIDIVANVEALGGIKPAGEE